MVECHSFNFEPSEIMVAYQTNQQISFKIRKDFFRNGLVPPGLG